MKTEIEIFNRDNTKKVIITRSRDFSSTNPKAFDYYLTPLFFQPFLNLGWCLIKYKQTISIHSLSDAKMRAKDYLYNKSFERLKTGFRLKALHSDSVQVTNKTNKFTIK